ncbi:MAG TPA: hypothetical protein VIB38_06215 [Aestuariivirgaceae bacterium]
MTLFRSILPPLTLIALCFGAASADAASRSYSQPRVMGHAVDHCLEDQSQCGKPAADAYCRHEGYQNALSFRLERDPARISVTVAVDSGSLQRAPAAQPFQMVKCWRPNDAPTEIDFSVKNLPSPATCDFGQDCRKSAADLWCTGKGYALGASAYELAPGQARFRLISCATL